MRIFLVFIPLIKQINSLCLRKWCLEKKYPFLIANTGRSNQGRTHWWSIMNISPKSELFSFDSYGIEGMKHVIISDGRKTIGEIFKGIETIDQKDKKLTLCKLKFSMDAYERLKEKDIKKLSESAQDLFHLMHSFVKKRRINKLCKHLDAWRPYTNA